MNISLGQDTLKLKEVVVVKSYKSNAKKIFKKIKKQLKNNFETTERKYRINEISIYNQKDTLIYKDAHYNFNIKSLDDNFSKKIIEDEENIIFRNENFFKKYNEFRDSPEFWISNILYIKSLKVLNYDILKNYSKYELDISYDDDVIYVKFHSTDMYSGYLICDRNTFNIKKIFFKNSIQYPFTQLFSDNGKKKGLKSWNYLVESLTIEFETNQLNQLYIKSFSNNEVINDYFYERYDKKDEVIFKEGPFNFNSTVKIINY